MRFFKNLSATILVASATVVIVQPHIATAAGVGQMDDANLQVTVAAGTLTITTPYTPDNPLVLPPLTLAPDGTYLETSAPLSTPSEQIVVTSTLAGDPGWSVAVGASDLVDADGATIPSSGLGLTGGQLLDGNSFPGTVDFTDIPAHNPSPVDTDSNPGLSLTPQSWATTAASSDLSNTTGTAGPLDPTVVPAASNGTAVLGGTLTLLAPSSTPAGLYSGTISFTAV